MIVKTKNIERVILKNKELFAENAAETLKNKLTNLALMKDSLAKKHMELMELEKTIKSLEDELKPYNNLIEIVYETKEVEDKPTEVCNLIVNNPSDARNLNY